MEVCSFVNTIYKIEVGLENLSYVTCCIYNGSVHFERFVLRGIWSIGRESVGQVTVELRIFMEIRIFIVNRIYETEFK